MMLSMNLGVDTWKYGSLVSQVSTFHVPPRRAQVLSRWMHQPFIYGSILVLNCLISNQGPRFGEPCEPKRTAPILTTWSFFWNVSVYRSGPCVPSVGTCASVRLIHCRTTDGRVFIPIHLSLSALITIRPTSSSGLITEADNLHSS